MIRGTTPTFKLMVDDLTDLTEASHVYATFVQKGNKFTKTGSEIEVKPHEVDVYFSQSESLKFATGSIAIQLNWTYSDGSRACSDIVYTEVNRNLEEGVLL